MLLYLMIPIVLSGKFGRWGLARHGSLCPSWHLRVTLFSEYVGLGQGLSIPIPAVAA